MTYFLHLKERRMRVKLSQQWYQEKRFLFIYFFCNSIQSSLMVHVFLNKWQLTDFNLVSDSKVIRRLRERGEPIRLFGESDDEACQRLRLTEGVVFVAGKEKAHLTSPPKKKKNSVLVTPISRNQKYKLNVERVVIFSGQRWSSIRSLCCETCIRFIPYRSFLLFKFLPCLLQICNMPWWNAVVIYRRIEMLAPEINKVHCNVYP